MGPFEASRNVASFVRLACPRSLKLGIGDPVPKLSGAKWIKGDAVNSFLPNTVYVLEFWATWCGPCKDEIPSLQRLQQAGAVPLGAVQEAEPAALAAPWSGDASTSA